jgi:Fe-S-cluster containining protein
MDEPREIGPDIEAVLNRVLPETIAVERIRLLAEHADAVLALRNHAREVYRRRLIESAGALIDHGWSNTSAYDLAAIKLAEERRIMEQELEEQLDKLKDRLRGRLQSLCAGTLEESSPRDVQPCYTPQMADHTLDEFGEHDPEECYQCLVEKPAVKSECRCAECCRRLIIEVLPQDAEREPKIRERGSPLLASPDENGHREVVGYVLNSRDDIACVFLDRDTNLCTIHETRPLLCRLFDCDGEGREQLIELGIIERDE